MRMSEEGASPRILPFLIAVTSTEYVARFISPSVLPTAAAPGLITTDRNRGCSFSLPGAVSSVMP